jgi:hypothetical protein
VIAMPLLNVQSSPDAMSDEFVADADLTLK